MLSSVGRPVCSKSSLSQRLLSSSSSSFRPRRRPPRWYRPIRPVGVKVPGPRDPFAPPRSPDVIELGAYPDARDELERDYGPRVAEYLKANERSLRNGGDYTIEDYLQMADYLTAEDGSLEERVLERRGLARDLWKDEDQQEFMNKLEEIVEEARIESMELEKLEYPQKEGEDNDDDERKTNPWDEELDENGEPIDPNQLANGEWAEMIVRVDRVQKVQKGGTMVRYRALVIGGNANGCAGFGIAKANTPNEATASAARLCKRNIFFVDRYQNKALTQDLVGRHNSCKVILRAVTPNRGLFGHPLVNDILLFFGITDCTAKTHGNRNQYNVVRATFKAIMTHESLDDVALKRGKRLINLEQAKRLQI